MILMILTQEPDHIHMDMGTHEMKPMDTRGIRQRQQTVIGVPDWFQQCPVEEMEEECLIG